MYDWLWLIPALPIAGFLALVFSRNLGEKTAAAIGVGATAIPALLALVLGISFIHAPPPGHAYTQVLWTWFSVGGFAPDVALYLDALSVVMTVVITFVGSLILLFSVSYMHGDEGFSRFFAYMNLFVGSMLILVLGRNLLLLYLGWEGVGVCSYLLIGFWYKTPANAAAAMKAFIVTRVGDTFMAIGLFLLIVQFGTLDIPAIGAAAPQKWAVGSGLAVAAAALLLGGAVGKSAQLPLQTWLPDAMAGPTPVSALIHAATMVTAGVYLIARTHVLFELAPVVMQAVALIGCATLLMSGFAALVQTDIKRVLAYSTMSQIGYMFLALGVGAWDAGILHFFTHAFFKALLFLGAGAIIVRMHEEQNIFHLGGLRRELPVTFWTFLIGCLSLTALPPATAGFASKDHILYAVWVAPTGGPGLWCAAIVGVFVTSLYTARLFFVTFFGTAHHKPTAREGLVMAAPLVVLAALSAVIGVVEWPRTLGGATYFSDFVGTALPVPAHGEHESLRTEGVLQITADVISVLGVALAGVLYLGRRTLVTRLAQSAPGAWLVRFWQGGWGFDWAYDRLLVQPFIRLARWNRDDAIDRVYDGAAALTAAGHRAVRSVQTGRTRTYAAGIAVGAIIVLGILVVLR